METKATIITLLLIASLHGQASEGNQVAISAPRLANLNGLHIKYLQENNIVRFENNQAILNLTKLDNLLKTQETEGRFEQAHAMRSALVPYGCT